MADPLTNIKFSIPSRHTGPDLFGLPKSSSDPDYPIEDPGEVSEDDLAKTVIDALEAGKDYRHAWGDIHNHFLKQSPPKRMAISRVKKAFSDVVAAKNQLQSLDISTFDNEQAYIAAATSASPVSGKYARRWLGKVAASKGLRDGASFDSIKTSVAGSREA